MKNSLIMLFFVCAGIVFGSLAAHLSKGVEWLSWLSYGLNFGLTPPFVLDLNVLTITIGATFNLNIAIIIFVALSIFAGICFTRKRR